MWRRINIKSVENQISTQPEIEQKVVKLICKNMTIKLVNNIHEYTQP